MNPICKVDVNRPECQKWMIEVYRKCRDLFSSRSVNSRTFLWLDITLAPAVYKEHVESMTSADCHRLKRELARDVSDKVAEEEFEESRSIVEIVAIILAVVIILVVLILLSRIRWRKKKVEIEPVIESPDPEQPPSEKRWRFLKSKKEIKTEPEEPPPEIYPTRKRKKKTIKSWMRGNCRPLFVHSGAQMRKSQEKADREIAVHHELTREKIALWTKARERNARKKNWAKDTKTGDVKLKGNWSVLVFECINIDMSRTLSIYCKPDDLSHSGEPSYVEQGKTYALRIK